MREDLIQLLVAKLQSVQTAATAAYDLNKKKIGIGFCAIDDLLPLDYATKIAAKFDPENKAWREMNSFREKKLTTKQFDQFDSILKDITFAFQDPRVLQVVEKITGIPNQIPDHHLYAGGLSVMREEDFLDPHIDNSHDQEQKVYRRLNLLYYATPDWAIDQGGNLELWDREVNTPEVIHSRFNRLVLMETHDHSWHSVSPVKATKALRTCVSNYYFSKESPSGENYFHVTSFMARPEQPLKRIFCRVDNKLRSFLRTVKKSGFGKKDVYVQKG